MNDERIYVLESPLIKQGEVAALKVKALTKVGAFLDWGQKKDLLLPFHEQTHRPKEGETVVVGLYTDRTGRPCATMKLKRFSNDSPDLKCDDKVSGLVYEVRSGTGVLLFCEGKYFGLIPEQECPGDVSVGDIIEARVTKVRSDGKLDLSHKKKAYKQIDIDAQTLVKIMNSHGGKLGFDERAEPELIRQKTMMSKAAFKRAVGRLLRDAIITQKDGDIFLNP